MDFAWLYGKWKLFSLPFAKPHTYYSITDRVSGLSQNQVTHQFNLFHLVHEQCVTKKLLTTSNTPYIADTWYGLCKFPAALLKGKPSPAMCPNALPHRTRGKITILTHQPMFVFFPTTKVMPVVSHPKGQPQRGL